MNIVTEIAVAIVIAILFAWILRRAERSQEEKNLTLSDAWWRDWALVRERLTRRDKEGRE